MAGTLFTYGANATASPSFFQGVDTIAYSPLDYTSPVTLTLSEAGTVDLTTQLQGRGVTLTAAAAGNAVTTSDGDDTVTGGLGVDTLDGGAGNDTIYAAPPGSDEAASDTLIGGAGNDTLVDYLGATTNMSGGAGNDTIRLGGPQNQVGPSISGIIDGGADLDRLEPVAAGSSAHVAPLRLQNLVISNVEVLDASAGVIATASQYQGFQSLVNAAGRTLTLATAGSVQLGTQLAGQGVTFVGSTGNDRISLSGGADRIEAGEGDDTLIGLGGADQLLGGIGRDTVDYSGSLAAVTVNLALGTGSGGDAEGDTYGSIEAAIGSDFDDTFVATAAPETFDGGAGSDTVSYEYSTAAVTIDLATHSISGGYATGIR
ncbi:MAG: hypothetical protein J0I45_17810 [Bosea sp.]|nr:hypothetical protein [Bosea sp. (in: a-proteobacteria)]